MALLPILTGIGAAIATAGKIADKTAKKTQSGSAQSTGGGGRSQKLPEPTIGTAAAAPAPKPAAPQIAAAVSPAPAAAPVINEQSAAESRVRYNALLQVLDDYRLRSDSRETQMQAAYDAYRRHMEQEQARAAEQSLQLTQKATAEGIRRMEAERESIRRGYDDQARQAYIVALQQRKALPQRLAAEGMSGGASETALLGLDTAYQNQLGEIQARRLQALAELEQAQAQLQSTGDLQAARQALDAAKAAQQAYGALFLQQQEARQRRWTQEDQWAKDRLRLQADALEADRKQALSYADLQTRAEETARLQNEAERRQILESMGAYGADYQARINELQSDGDPANDWQIPYLQILRQQKLAELAAAENKREQDAFRRELALAELALKQAQTRYNTGKPYK